MLTPLTLIIITQFKDALHFISQNIHNNVIFIAYAIFFCYNYDEGRDRE